MNDERGSHGVSGCGQEGDLDMEHRTPIRILNNPTLDRRLQKAISRLKDPVEIQLTANVVLENGGVERERKLFSNTVVHLLGSRDQRDIADSGWSSNAFVMPGF
jgi:hypothetical protein